MTAKAEVNPPPRMDGDEAREFRHFAFVATSLFPGVIGETLAEPLLAAAEFGYRLNMSARAHRLVAALKDERRKREQAAAREWASGWPVVGEAGGT